MNPFKTTPVRRAAPPPDLEAAAAEALGGAPVRPPSFPTQAVAHAEAEPLPAGDPAARAAFTRAVAAAGTPQTFGNPTLDGLPAELLMRRSKAASARRALADLATRVLDDHRHLSAVLDDLGDDSADLQAAEMFDVPTARRLLDGLKAVVLSISSAPQPAAPAEETPAAEESPAGETDA